MCEKQLVRKIQQYAEGVDPQAENAYYGVPVSVLLAARKSSAVRDGRYSA